MRRDVRSSTGRQYLQRPCGLHSPAGMRATEALDQARNRTARHEHVLGLFVDA